MCIFKSINDGGVCYTRAGLNNVGPRASATTQVTDVLSLSPQGHQDTATGFFSGAELLYRTSPTSTRTRRLKPDSGSCEGIGASATRTASHRATREVLSAPSPTSSTNTSDLHTTETRLAEADPWAMRRDALLRSWTKNWRILQR